MIAAAGCSRAGKSGSLLAMSTAESNAGKTLVAVATYNEIENLPALVDEIFRHAPKVDLLVIDDNSPDGTGRWCDSRALDDRAGPLLASRGQVGAGNGNRRGDEIRAGRGL